MRRCVPQSTVPARDGQRSALHGQVMIIFAIASLVLVGFVALSVDTGFLMAERRQAQNAADAGALAAAKSMFDGMNPAQIVAAGKAYGAMNADVPTGNVSVVTPPTSGAYMGNSKYVQVTITKEVDKFFVGALYAGPWEVEATATAGIEEVPGNIAMLALNPDAGGINMVGNSGITATGDQASIMSNYNLRATGNVNVTATGYVNANNGFNKTGNVTFDGVLGESGSAPEVPDPFEGVLSAPSIPNCPAQDDAPITFVGNNPYTINPGTHVYHGQAISMTGNQTLHIGSGDHVFWFCDGAGIQLVGNSQITKGANTRVKMYFIGGDGIRLVGNSSWSVPSGEYYFVNSDLTCTGNQSLVGTDVFMYFSGDGKIDVTGNTRFSLSAPQTMIYPGYVPGVLLFADKNNSQTIEWVGNSGASSVGAIYVPSATLDFVGNSSMRVAEGQLIADHFTFTGNSSVSVHYREIVDATMPKLYLVE